MEVTNDQRDKIKNFITSELAVLAYNCMALNNDSKPLKGVSEFNPVDFIDNEVNRFLRMLTPENISLIKDQRNIN